MRRPDCGGNGPGGKTFLGLGSNLGDRLGFLRQGLMSLEDRGIRVVRASSIYDTDPVGFREQGNFLNLAAEVAWDGEPRELLRRCLAVEKGTGRERTARNGPRTLDIDILLCGRWIYRGAGLEIPHPRLHERRFVLVPLDEIAPGIVHPLLGLTVRDLLARCPDPSGVRKLHHPLALERVDPSGYNPAASRGKRS